MRLKKSQNATFASRRCQERSWARSHRGLLLVGACGRVLGHAVRQCVGDERDARIGLAAAARVLPASGPPAAAPPAPTAPRAATRSKPRASRGGAACSGRHPGCTPRSRRGCRSAGRSTSPSWSHSSNSTMLEPASRRRISRAEVVERLDPLDRVALDRGAKALAHRPEQVDEHAASEEPVDLLLARCVPAHQSLQRSRLV